MYDFFSISPSTSRRQKKSFYFLLLLFNIKDALSQTEIRIRDPAVPITHFFLKCSYSIFKQADNVICGSQRKVHKRLKHHRWRSLPPAEHVERIHSFFFFTGVLFAEPSSLRQSGVVAAALTGCRKRPAMERRWPMGQSEDWRETQRESGALTSSRAFRKLWPSIPHVEGGRSSFQMKERCMVRKFLFCQDAVLSAATDSLTATQSHGLIEPLSAFLLFTLKSKSNQRASWHRPEQSVPVVLSGSFLEIKKRKN